MVVINTYEDKASQPSSEKILLAHLDTSVRAVTWTLDSGAIYKRTPRFYVIDVKLDTASLSEASSSALSAGEWFYEPEDNEVFVRMSDGSNPEDSFVSLVLRVFLSDAPVIITNDLTETGVEVEYLPLIDKDVTIPQGLEHDDQLGIALESSGSISFMNSDGFWDPIFDKLSWENKNISIYSWFTGTKFSEARKIFKGITDNKSFSETSVSFKIKDLVFQLRQPLNLNTYTLSDGDISDDVLGKFKRRIYGQVVGIKIQSIDQTLGGYALSGTISAAIDSSTVTGSGTSFLSELSPGDRFPIGDTDFTVDSIESNTSLTISETTENAFSGQSVIISPDIPYRRKNRTHLIAGHKLRQPTTTVSDSQQLNRISVADPTDFLVGDLVKVGSQFVTIRRISSSLIVFTTNLNAIPSNGTAVVKNPVSTVYFKGLQMVIDRDWSVTNTSSGAELVLDDLAEFNITKTNKIRGTTITFTSSSRNVTGSGTAFTKDLNTRDWVRSGDTSHIVWYEVLEVVDDTNLKIRTTYGGSTFPGSAQKRNVVYIDDNSPVIVDCTGKENAAGDWVKTIPDVVKDILDADADISGSDIDSTSFSDADIGAPYIASISFPLTPLGSAPKVRDAISLCNKSIFGSLIQKTDFTMAYDVLFPEKPEDLEEIGDDDIINFSASTKNKIVRKANIRYKHFDADIHTEESGATLIEFINTSVDNLIGTKDELTREVYLFTASDAQIIAERYGFLHSLSQQIVVVNAKMDFTLNNINDKLFLGFDRLYHRFGGPSVRKKIGIISKMKRSGQNTQLTLTDLSGMFNRVGAIAPDDANDFASATDTEKLFNSYIVDDDTELPDSSATTDDESGVNLIG